jgi:hypothetical protein
MKRTFSAVAILLLLAAILYLWLDSRKKNENTTLANPTPVAESQTIPPRNTSPNISASSATAPATAVPNSPPGNSAQTSPSNPAALTGTVSAIPNAQPNVPPEATLQNVRIAVRQYGQMFGGDPVGTNPEITRQLNGDNPRHINFIDAQAGMVINAKGELVDAWGTPYFFHQISGTEMEIHSAGPDKIMWTSDDLVAK